MSTIQETTQKAHCQIPRCLFLAHPGARYCFYHPKTPLCYRVGCQRPPRPRSHQTEVFADALCSECGADFTRSGAGSVGAWLAGLTKRTTTR